MFYPSIGESPSGKAAAFGAAIRGFESLLPSQVRYNSNMHKADDSFIIEDFNGFKIVRDDLHDGGTKHRAFRLLIGTIKEEELVYACDYYGAAAYAIAKTANEVGKKTSLFYLSPKQATDFFKKATSLPNVTYEIVENAPTQIAASVRAKAYAKEHGARFLPIGLDFPEFGEALEKVVKSANLDGPEIWCMGGSGTLGRALQRAYPDIPVNIVSVGTANFNGGTNTVYNAPEKLDEDAEIRPPYPSSSHYDAKIWRFVLQKAKKGSCVWNVA